MKLIAEIGPADGSLLYAWNAVTAAAQAGAWMVKGQLYRRDTLVTQTAFTYGHSSLREPETQWDNFANVLSYEDWQTVKDHCDELGVEFGASVFDLQAVEACERMGATVKIASGDITFRQLIERAAASGLPLIISTGGSYAQEIKQAARWVWAAGGRDVTWLACTMCYPTKVGDANLLRMRSLQELLQTDRVGYSDHTEGVQVALRAFELGAVMVEKHFTVTPMAGGDHNFAATPQQFEQLIDTLTAGLGSGWEEGDGSPLLMPLACEATARTGARRSLTVTRGLPAGHILTDDDLMVLRPGTGIAPDWLEAVVGCELRMPVMAGTVLTRRMVHL